MAKLLALPVCFFYRPVVSDPQSCDETRVGPLPIAITIHTRNSQEQLPAFHLVGTGWKQPGFDLLCGKIQTGLRKITVLTNYF